MALYFKTAQKYYLLENTEIKVFEIDYQNPSIAYITIQKKTDTSDGVIEIHNLDIAPTRNSEINKDISLSLSEIIPMIL